MKTLFCIIGQRLHFYKGKGRRSSQAYRRILETQDRKDHDHNGAADHGADDMQSGFMSGCND